MIITSLLDTDLYKFTMMQVVLHHFPGAQVEYRFKCRNENVDLVPCIDEIEAEIRSLCRLRFAARRARLPARVALPQERLRRPARAVPARRALRRVDASAGFADARSTSRSRAPGCTRSCSRCRCWRSSARSTSGARSRSPTSPRVARRLAAKIEPINAVADPEFRIADYGTRRRFSGPGRRRSSLAHRAAHRTEVRRHEQRLLRARARADAAGHDGARVPAGLPGRRPAPARLADVRVQHLGARVSRRPRDRAVRRLRHGRVPARLRPLLLQAVRRRAPRLGRPVRVGREADRALPEDAHRPAHEDDGVLRQRSTCRSPSALRVLQGPQPDGVRHRHQPHQRPGLRAAADRDQDDPLQRAAGGEDQRRAVEVDGLRPVVRRVPARGVPGARNTARWS